MPAYFSGIDEDGLCHMIELTSKNLEICLKSISYYNLLIKYMAHVGMEEGTFFTGRSLDNASVLFTKAEKEMLRSLEEHANKVERDVMESYKK
jgi:hypothetical protein